MNENFSNHQSHFSRPQFNFKQRHGNWKTPRPPFMQRFRPPHLRPPYGMTPEGFQLPAYMQAPPMFGPRGPTIPPRMMHNYRPNHRQNHQNKPMQILDASNSHWCETCDRGFKSSQQLDTHKLEHQKCGIDGCEFIAHPKVVTLHIQMQHSSGLYDKIRNINTPEDIDNWIKERKKNYPSKENIEKKKAQQKECFDRGEKLNENKNRFNKNRRDRHSNFRDKRMNMDKRNSFNKGESNQKDSLNKPKKKETVKPKPIDKVISKTSEDDSHCNLQWFKGTSELIRLDTIKDETPLVLNDIDIEDQEWLMKENATETVNVQKTNVSVCSALGDLISAYDSFSDEELNISDKNKRPFDKIPYLPQLPNRGNQNNPASCNESKLLTKDMSENINNKIKSKQEIPHTVTNVDGMNNDSDSGPEEAVISKSNGDILNTEIVKQTPNQKRKRKHSNTDKTQNIEPMLKTNPNNGRNQYNRRKMPKTLLEKLLEKDIKHERNIVLQCIHFIIENNFFDK